VTLINLTHSNIEYLVGKPDVKVAPQVPYSNLSCEFLNDLSKVLMTHEKIREYPDVMTFAFWCRRANIEKLIASFLDNKTRLGLGLVFHIAPSNVPINFAFSFVFGLLSGNSNVVRVPSVLFYQVGIICNALRNLLDIEKYHIIKLCNSFIRYERSDEITAFLSKSCNARLIWGGDNTIKNIRQSAISPRCRDIAFSDRYSFSIISSDSVIGMNDQELERLIEGFYNDTYLMDQNACSSPHLVIWIGQNKADAQQKFWTSLHNIVKAKYLIPPVVAVDKYTWLCKNAIEMDDIAEFKSYDNLIYILKLNNLFDTVDHHHGKFGHFFEYEADVLDEIVPIVNLKYQTLTYCGVDSAELKDIVVSNSLLGIDRIIPIGQAMDMSVIWDGYDIVKNLSRIIDYK
jgi:hypothetical protein